MNKCKKVFLKLLLFFIVAFLLLLAVFYTYIYYAERMTTNLFVDISQLNHHISVTELGHNTLSTRYHTVQIEVDNIVLVKFGVYSSDDTSLFSTEDILCETDNDSEYRIVFREEKYGQNVEILFSSDFSKVLYVKCWDFECIDKTMLLVVRDEYD